MKYFNFEQPYRGRQGFSTAPVVLPPTECNRKFRATEEGVLAAEGGRRRRVGTRDGYRGGWSFRTCGIIPIMVPENADLYQKNCTNDLKQIGRIPQKRCVFFSRDIYAVEQGVLVLYTYCVQI